jgi:hypothetical protein
VLGVSSDWSNGSDGWGSIGDWSSVSVVGNWGGVGVVGNWSSVSVVSDWGSNSGNWSGISDWSGNWGSDSDGWGSIGDWSGNGVLDSDGWGLSVNNGVESVDWISGVGHGSDGTIGLDEGVLSLDNISVSALRGGLGVSGKSVRDGVSVVVLWMRVVWLSSDGLGDWGSIGDWGSDSSDGWGGIGDWSGSIGWSSISWGSVGDWGSSHGGVVDLSVRVSVSLESWGTSGGEADHGEDGDGLDHLAFFLFLQRN